jgi:hypothetical protein
LEFAQTAIQVTGLDGVLAFQISNGQTVAVCLNGQAVFMKDQAAVSPGFSRCQIIHDVRLTPLGVTEKRLLPCSIFIGFSSVVSGVFLLRGTAIIQLKPMTQKEILDLAHHNTLFSQILSLIPGHVFQTLERRHKTGRSSRQFGFKEQFTIMAFVQLAARRSLREGLRCLSAAGRRLYHWGLKSVACSTVCDANRERPTAFFQELCSSMYQRCLTLTPSHKFKYKTKLFSLDSTTVSLCLSIFPWAAFRSKKTGIKMYAILDHDGHIPAFVTITEAKCHDRKAAAKLNLPKGSIVAFDKAYNCYSWFRTLTDKSVFFVTRLKDNARYKIRQRRTVRRKAGLTSDQTITVKCQKEPLVLRKIGYRDLETGKHFQFPTNDFNLAAKTIADIYKERWRIEIFFREVKQNLHIKSFVGTSENAVLIQIFTALTVYLLLAYMKFMARIGLSVQRIFQLVQLNLMGTSSWPELFKQRTMENNLLNDSLLFNSIA